MKPIVVILITIISVCQVSCGEASREVPQNEKEAQVLNDVVLTQTPANATAMDTVAAPVLNGQAPADAPDKKIIKTAALEVECSSFQLFNQQVHGLAKQYAAWVAQESEEHNEYRDGNTVSIKVPVHLFDDMLAAIGKLDGKTIVKNIQAQDVTSQITDTKGRIEAKRLARERYFELMRQAKNMEDILKVQTEIDDIQEEFELNNARLQSLQHQAAYSTINLHFFQTLVAGSADDTPGFFSRLVTAFKNGFVLIGDLLIGLTNMWPLLLLVLGVVYLFKRKAVAKASDN